MGGREDDGPSGLGIEVLALGLLVEWLEGKARRLVLFFLLELLATLFVPIGFSQLTIGRRLIV